MSSFNDLLISNFKDTLTSISFKKQERTHSISNEKSNINQVLNNQINSADYNPLNYSSSNLPANASNYQPAEYISTDIKTEPKLIESYRDILNTPQTFIDVVNRKPYGGTSSHLYALHESPLNDEYKRSNLMLRKSVVLPPLVYGKSKLTRTYNKLDLVTVPILKDHVDEKKYYNNPPEFKASPLLVDDKIAYINDEIYTFCTSSFSGDVDCFSYDSKKNDAKKLFNYKFDNSVLCSAWKNERNAILCGGLDKLLCSIDATSQECIKIGHHDGPISHVFSLDNNLAVTGSYDKNIKYWDFRSPTPSTVFVSGRVACMDLSLCGNYLSVGIPVDSSILVYDLRSPLAVYKRLKSSFGTSTRNIAILPDISGIAISSLDGRFCIQYFDNQENLAFNCHRDDCCIYAVHSIKFHPLYKSLITVGGDGCISSWDTSSKLRMYNIKKSISPITTCQFSPDGNIFLYGTGYDWSKGHINHNILASLHLINNSGTENWIIPNK